MTGSTVVTWASCAVAAGLAASAAASTNPIDERGKTVMSYSLKAASARDGIASPPPPATAIPALSDRRRTERSEERRVGKEGGSTCRSRGAPYQTKKKKRKNSTSRSQRNQND